MTKITSMDKNPSLNKTTDAIVPDELLIRNSWKIIIADDDEEVHRITKVVLKDYRFEDIPLELLHAYTAKDTTKLLKKNPDTALIILDVVMETDHAGLELVKTIRGKMNNNIVQIILRTGQPGLAPEQRVILDYDINNYTSKQDLTTQKLHTAITSSLRSYKISSSYNDVNKKLNHELSERRSVETKLKRTLQEMENLSLTDELTGLYNRRGFFTLAEQQLKLSKRLGKPIMLFFMDLDGLKTINDNLGHTQGDRALVDASEIIKMTFRESDIIGRIGGDEFVVLSVDSSKQYDERIITRLMEKINSFNDSNNRDYILSISVGTAEYDPDMKMTINRLLESADRHMYLIKAQKKNLNNYNVIK